MPDRLHHPFDPHLVLKRKKSIKKELVSDTGSRIEKKIAILGGSTTAEIKNILELFLLKEGIEPRFFESEYNKYYEDIMFGNEELKSFGPDIIFIHTTVKNITQTPRMGDSAEEVDRLLDQTFASYEALWQKIEADYGCDVIQNNFELPQVQLLGNMDASDYRGLSNFVSRLNARFAEYATAHKSFHLHDIHYLAADFGLSKWYDDQMWHSYKYAFSYEAIPYFAYSLASVIKAVYGKTKKCLVLDLDNTLWGGVIGDDGLHGIKIGKETPQAEAYTAFQRYVKSLKERGIMLAVCSKNDEKNAKEGFTHPDSILKLEDFTVFKANWEPKFSNIDEIAKEINIGLDALVFVDDNPAERDIVKSQLPMVEVPDIGDDITHYIDYVDSGRYFESVSLSSDDLKRNQYYADNAKRDEMQSKFKDYGEFLTSLDMVAEIKRFQPLYLERITQLTNKTNQFNLTTRRYTSAEIESIAQDENYIPIYGKLSDKFGDNGLIAISIGRIEKGDELHLDLWLMSCRVLKRDMEQAMLDAMVRLAEIKQIKTIFGYYYRTKKNDMVAGLYQRLGFEAIEESEESSRWKLDISQGYDNQNKYIKVEHD